MILYDHKKHAKAIKAINARNDRNDRLNKIKGAESALNKITGSLSDWSYHNLLKEIETIKDFIYER